ncbi:MAG: SDR family NAD(P)-dependent oxidoreductase [Renibacterium sp.]|nr:SDR family NAD(P)-dependent oxidoreductase [Renibacterium sp.]
MDLKKLEAQGAVALITGAGSGLGAATARKLHASGVAVAILDLPNSPGAEVAAELNLQRGGSAIFTPADVTNEEQVKAAVAQAKELGPVRILVNAAGIQILGSIIGPEEDRLSLANFAKNIQVNLIGSFNVLRYAAEAMAETEPLSDGLGGLERGVIINTSSCLGFDGQAGTSGYSASKGGILALSMPIARELANSFIRVMDISPGLFMTPILGAVPDEVLAKATALIPQPKRVGDPSEFAALVEHIVTNAMFNGTSLRLDGGLRLSFDG